MKRKNEEMSLADLVNLFIPKIWFILSIAIIMAAALGLGSKVLIKDTYTSVVTLYSYKESTSTDLNDINVAQQQVKTYEQVFKSNRFINFVVAELTPEQRELYTTIGKPSISVQQKDSTEVFDVKVTSRDPALAYAVAEAVATVSLERLTEFIPNAVEVTVIDAPVAPSTPNSKNVVRNAIIGFLGGVVLTMIAIFVYSSFDVIIHDRKKIEDNFDAPILGVIPRHEMLSEEYSSSAKNQDQPKQKVKKTRYDKIKVHDTSANDSSRLINDNTPFAIKEAFRTLYTNVLYLPIESKTKKIAVTSAFSGEGKTYVSINLALTIARSDEEHNILLLDADMRKPRVSKLLKSVRKSAHGLSEYLAGIDDVPNIQQTDIPNLSVISSGSESANATGLIISSRFSELMKYLQDKFTYIIIDTPPTNIVSDAALLSEHVDGYLLVSRADYSDINSLTEAVDNLEQVDCKIFGMCLTSLEMKNYSYRNKKYKNYSKYGRYGRYGRYGKYARYANNAAYDSYGDKK